MVVRLTRSAQRQRAAILKYRAEAAGRRSAAELREAFKESVELIRGWAPPGVSRTDLASANYRFVLVEPYWVIWRLGENEDRVIVAFVDARRDIASMKFD